MMFKVEAHTKGIEKLQRELRDLQRKAEALGKIDFVSFDELFPTAFLTKHTDFASVEDMFEASGFVVESQEDFEKIPDTEWDDFIKNNTRFSSWEKMMGIASKEFAARKLGLSKS